MEGKYETETDGLSSEDISERPWRGKPIYVPTPAEIAAACAEIQSGWTAEERYLRLRGWGKKGDRGS